MESYWTRLQRKGLSRRRLLAGAAAGGAGLGLTMAGCGGGGEEPKPAATATGAAGQPKRGGVLRTRFTTEAAHLDVSTQSSTIFQEPGMPMYSNLVRFDPKRLPKERVLIGDLAESWKINPDGTEYVFNLRRGVTWHDGKPFTSRDVAATFKRAKEVNSYKDLLAPIREVATPDDNTAVLRLSEPASYLLALLQVGSSLIVPEHIISTDPKSLETKPVGTGPFKFGSWDKGVKITLQRNDNYFLSGQPYLDGIQFTKLDPTSEVPALRTNQIDLVHYSGAISQVALKELQSAVPGLQVSRVGASAMWVLLMNVTRPPFNDPRVRKAVSLVLDQKQIIDLAAEGLGDTGGYVQGGMALSDDQRKKLMPWFRGITKDDVAEAKKLMEAAGLGSGIEIDYERGNLQPSEDNFQTVLQNQLKQIGMTLKPKVLKYPTETIPNERAHNYQMAETSWVFAIVHPASSFVGNVTGNTDNRTGYSNPQFDALYKKLVAATNDDEEKKISNQMEEMLANDVPWMPLYHYLFFPVARPEVKNYTGPRYLRDYYDYVDVWLQK